MYWRDVVTLKAVTEGRDADGYPKEKITETTVFADVSSTKSACARTGASIARSRATASSMEAPSPHRGWLRRVSL